MCVYPGISTVENTRLLNVCISVWLTLMMSLKPLGSLRKGFNCKKHQKLVVATEIIKKVCCFCFFFKFQLKLICQREVIHLCCSLFFLALCCICTSLRICTKYSLFLPSVSYLWWLWLRVHPTCCSGVLRGKSIRYPSPCLETARSPLFVSNTSVWLTFSNKRNKPKVMLTNRVQLHVMKETSLGCLRLWL